MTSLHISRVVPMTVDQIWSAFTRPEEVAAWFWPPSLHARVTTDVRPGGAYRIEGTGMAVGGEYLETLPPNRLVFTWQWDGDDTRSTVTVGFTARDGKTELSLNHDGLADDADRENHVVGWNDCLDRLAAA